MIGHSASALRPLPDFPRAVRPSPPAALPGRGIALRHATSADLPFLRELYAGFRFAELLPLPWSEAEKQAFLDDQFRLQHLHFTTHFPKADFWIVEESRPAAVARAVGRLYLDRSGADWRIIDIGLAGAMRGGGLGTALIEWTQQACIDAGGTAIDLHVMTTNARARALYERLGFVVRGEVSGYHQPMRWTARSAVS